MTTGLGVAPGRGVFMQQKRLMAFLIAAACGVATASATPPAFRTDFCSVRLDGVRVGSDLTPGNSSLRNSIAYEPASGLYHFWGFAADDANFPSAASALPAVRHATSTDGTHFVSDGHLSYDVGSADFHG